MTTIFRRQSCRCRCSRHACQSRKTLTKHPDAYVRRPVCQSCHKGFYRPDRYRTDGREAAGKTCRCGGYSFPHVRGRGYCMENHRITAEMMQERYESRSFA